MVHTDKFRPASNKPSYCMQANCNKISHFFFYLGCGQSTCYILSRKKRVSGRRKSNSGQKHATEIIQNPGDRAKNNKNVCPTEFSIPLYLLSYEQICTYKNSKIRKPHITIGLMARFQDSQAGPNCRCGFESRIGQFFFFSKQHNEQKLHFFSLQRS